jgi:hypothetical protein
MAHLAHATTSDLSPLSGGNPDIEQTSPTDRVRPKPVIGPLEIGHDCREQLPSALMRKPHVIEHHLEWGNARGGDLRLPGGWCSAVGRIGAPPSWKGRSCGGT